MTPDEFQTYMYAVRGGMMAVHECRASCSSVQACVQAMTTHEACAFPGLHS